MTGDCCVFKFHRRGVDGKHFFKTEKAVFKFLRRRRQLASGDSKTKF